MKYVELTVVSNNEAEELVADIFWNYTDFGVAVCSVRDVIELTENRRSTFDYIDETLFEGDENVSFIKGYFPESDAAALCSAIRSDLDRLKDNSRGLIETGTLETITRTVEGDDWINVWKKHFKPIVFDKIVICPEWIKFDGERVVTIGSNTAFGTGEHETTSMCVEYLERFIEEGQTVIDVGTGSGILGIAAAKLGAGKVYMTDNDDKAIEAANYNAVKNGVKDICLVEKGDLFGSLNVKGDVVVANITAEILALLSKDISSYLKENGVAILSGILNDRLGFVLDTYLPLGFALTDKKTKGEWTAIALKYVRK